MLPFLCHDAEELHVEKELPFTCLSNDQVEQNPTSFFPHWMCSKIKRKRNVVLSHHEFEVVYHHAKPVLADKHVKSLAQSLALSAQKPTS